MKSKINAQIQVIREYKDIMAPQANDLGKIVIAIKVLKHSPINEKDLSTGFSMASRQGDYYSNAMRFLKLIDSYEYDDETIIQLTTKALQYFAKGSIEKNLRQWIWDNNLLEEYRQKVDMISADSSTKKRRLSSLKAWKEWVNGK